MSETKTATIIPLRTPANIDGAYRAAAAEQMSVQQMVNG